LNFGAFAYVEKAGDPDELLRYVHRAFQANLRSYAYELETAVAKRTHDLFQANESLKKEIIERKRAEETLRRERDKAQKYLDVAGVMLVAIDTEQRIGLINKKGCEILGYKEEEVLGKNWFDNFLPERIRGEVIVVFNKLVAEQDDTPEYYENPILTKNGHERLIAWRNTFLRDKKGSIIAALSSGEDITERKKSEEILLEYQAKLKAMASEAVRTEERERRRIAVGLHDEICQKLVMTKLALEASLPLISESNVLGSLKVACGAIGETIKQADSLTFELSNPILHELGFTMALKKYLSEDVQQKHGIAFELEGDERLRIPQEEIKSCLFRVSRELLMNIVKHAKAHNVKVSIHKRRNRVHIVIQDDGMGFNSDKVNSEIFRTSRFGLFSIREQLEHLGGNLVIKSEKGQGTTATVVVPLGKNSLG